MLAERKRRDALMLLGLRRTLTSALGALLDSRRDEWVSELVAAVKEETDGQ